MCYFVKFVPYNQNTLSSLINKTIKFSTVYEFNDFNELHFMAPRGFPGNYPTLSNKIKDFLQKINFRSSILKESRERSFTDNHLKNLENFINDYSPQSKDFETFGKVILEHAVFSSVGIFCVSDIRTFEDDAAQLMFAHYADNLKGLALIYEIDSGYIKKINYNNKDDLLKSPSGGEFSDWIDHIFTKSSMDDFLNKSNNWQYEKEARLFAKPSIQEAKEHNISLKAILHTTRFKRESLETLNNINKNFYSGRLRIQEIIPSYQKYMFNYVDEKGELKPISEFLEHLSSKKDI